jgi:hypothetical protein
VTGASRGIGKATALALGKAGCKVSITTKVWTACSTADMICLCTCVVRYCSCWNSGSSSSMCCFPICCLWYLIRGIDMLWCNFTLLPTRLASQQCKRPFLFFLIFCVMIRLTSETCHCLSGPGELCPILKRGWRSLQRGELVDSQI